MALWLLQVLCPSRHAIVAVPYDPDEHVAAAMEVAAATTMAEHGINPWCGLCGSHELHAEHAPMKWATLEEALPHLQETERQNQLARALLGNRY